MKKAYILYIIIAQNICFCFHHKPQKIYEDYTKKYAIKHHLTADRLAMIEDTQEHKEIAKSDSFLQKLSNKNSNILTYCQTLNPETIITENSVNTNLETCSNIDVQEIKDKKL